MKYFFPLFYYVGSSFVINEYIDIFLKGLLDCALTNQIVTKIINFRSGTICFVELLHTQSNPFFTDRPTFFSKLIFAREKNIKFWRSVVALSCCRSKQTSKN